MVVAVQLPPRDRGIGVRSTTLFPLFPPPPLNEEEDSRPRSLKSIGGNSWLPASDGSMFPPTLYVRNRTREDLKSYFVLSFFPITFFYWSHTVSPHSLFQEFWNSTACFSLKQDDERERLTEERSSGPVFLLPLSFSLSLVSFLTSHFLYFQCSLPCLAPRWQIGGWRFIVVTCG